ncbi:MAG: AraC family transcriptional regulator [Clostridiales bacterium]|nr:AraC family transcriptional regulator [Clostridiales bacterium]
MDQPLKTFDCKKFRTPYDTIQDFSHQPRPTYCLAYLFSGSTDFIQEERCVHVRQGEMIFIPFEDCYYSHWLGNPDTQYCTLFFNFRPFSAPFRDHLFPLQRIIPTASMIEKQLFILENNKKADQALSVLGAVYSLLGELYPLLKKREAPSVHAQIWPAVSYLCTHYTENITIEELAQMCHMSVSNFHNRFKQEMKLSPIAYKNQLCIDQAAQILLSSAKKSIEEISSELGFESSTYFRRVFKQYTGLSPRIFRQNARDSL